MELVVVHPYGKSEVADVESVFLCYHCDDVSVLDDVEQLAWCCEGFFGDVVGDGSGELLFSFFYFVAQLWVVAQCSVFVGMGCHVVYVEQF